MGMVGNYKGTMHSGLHERVGFPAPPAHHPGPGNRFPEPLVHNFDADPPVRQA